MYQNTDAGKKRRGQFPCQKSAHGQSRGGDFPSARNICQITREAPTRVNCSSSWAAAGTAVLFRA